jgi:hypothetical protein
MSKPNVQTDIHAIGQAYGISDNQHANSDAIPWSTERDRWLNQGGVDIGADVGIIQWWWQCLRGFWIYR